LRALTAFYASVGAFAAASFFSVLGASFGSRARLGASVAVALSLLATLAGAVGVGGLLYGCALVFVETRLALRGLRDEAAMVRKRFSG
jgi:hypothetical protein